mmetsp:Transcript_16886/g.26302  ORF Transcript_16886/g.26302 Transcript_16886/m.26302 type:complete len:213 (-) Transcript_16886:51-689(-)
MRPAFVFSPFLSSSKQLSSSFRSPFLSVCQSPSSRCFSSQSLSFEFENEAKLLLLSRCLEKVVTKPRQNIFLVGGLGTGKTTFTREFVRARAGGPVVVNSPTYLLEIEYPFPQCSLHHIDCFRFQENSKEYEILDLEKHLKNGICLIEWANFLPQKIWDLADPLTVHLSLTRSLSFKTENEEEEGRRVEVSGGERWGEVLAAVKEEMKNATL